MRRHKQQLPTEECKRLLAQVTNGVLALSGDNDYPYAVPLSFVYADGRIIFHSAREGHKMDALLRRPKASFCVVCQDEIHPAEYTTYFRSVIAFGRIRLLEGEEKTEALRLLGRRYNPGEEEALQREINKAAEHTAVFQLEIEHLSGKEAIELARTKSKSIHEKPS